MSAVRWPSGAPDSVNRYLFRLSHVRNFAREGHVGIAAVVGETRWDGQDLSRFSRRFEDDGAYRLAVWRVLIDDLFGRYLSPGNGVLDLGCGHGEFINQVQGAERYAMDLNPATGRRLDPAVKLFAQDCATPWPLADATLDLIFSSNFFEHLPDKAACLSDLA